MSVISMPFFRARYIRNRNPRLLSQLLVAELKPALGLPEHVIKIVFERNFIHEDTVAAKWPKIKPLEAISTYPPK